MQKETKKRPRPLTMLGGINHCGKSLEKTIKPSVYFREPFLEGFFDFGPFESENRLEKSIHLKDAPTNLIHLT